MHGSLLKPYTANTVIDFVRYSLQRKYEVNTTNHEAFLDAMNYSMFVSVRTYTCKTLGFDCTKWSISHGANLHFMGKGGLFLVP